MSFRTYSEVTGPDRSGLGEQVAQQRARVAERLASVSAIVAVLSGKGGVGKSYVSAGLARACRAAGRSVGVVDADLRSPTVARLLRAEGPLVADEQGIEPARGTDDIRVMSSDFLLEDGRPLGWRGTTAERFVWTGAIEIGALREFLSDVKWGVLDLLLIDLPPGADAVADLHPLIPNLTGVVAVTIPTEESRRSVARALAAARDDGLPILGIVENMVGCVCPSCREAHPLFEGDAADRLSEEFDVPVWGRVPFGAGREPFVEMAERLAECTVRRP